MLLARAMVLLLVPALTAAQPGCRGPSCTATQPQPLFVVQVPIALDGTEGSPGSIARDEFANQLTHEVADALALTPGPAASSGTASTHVALFTLRTTADAAAFSTVQFTFMSASSNTTIGLAPATVSELDALVVLM